MKKLAIVALAAALVIALTMPAMAETKIGGDYRVRGIYWDQGLDKGKFGGNGGIDGVGRYFDNRLRLNLNSTVTDTVAVHVVADSGLGYNGRNGDFQNPAATPDSYDGIWNRGGSLLNMPDPASADRDGTAGHDIVFQQAYMDFATPIGAFSIGRQWAFWGMGLAVGENRNRLAWSYKLPSLQVGAGYDKFLEAATPAGAFTNNDDQSNYFVWGLFTPAKDIQVGPYFEYTHANSVGGLTGLDTYKLSLFGNANMGPLGLSAEFAYAGGSGHSAALAKDVDISAWALAGRGTMNVQVATVGVEAGYVSGQDPNKNDKIQAFTTPFSFQPFAILGSLAINAMDLNGNATVLPAGLGAALGVGGSGQGSYSNFVSNMIYGKAFVRATPLPKLDAYLALGYAAVAKEALMSNGGGRGNSLGTELDLSLTYAITPNLSYNFTAGYLATGDFYKNGNLAINVGTTPLGTAEKENCMLAVHSISVNW
jgi:hypothetical protein